NDMRFVDSEDRSAIESERARWTNGIVPYYISTSFTSQERAVLEKGLQMISSSTCITFR
ncbi:unnamed protein product, partial [Allacma fusca]